MSDPLNRRDLLTLAGGAAALGLGLPGVASAAASRHHPLHRNPAKDSPLQGSASLRAHADRKGLLCGTAVTARGIASDAQLRQALIADCNILVPENELKWDTVQPTPDGPLNFAPAEAIYAFAAANNMKMRGHALSWFLSQPKWAVEQIPLLSAAAAGDRLEKYVTDVVTHWRGRLVQWDVVNEPIWANDKLPDKLYGAKLGERFIDIAFNAAHAADPGVLLNLNADGVAQDGPYQLKQRDSTLRLLERLVARGVPIKSFGFEAHLNTAYGFSEPNWREFLDRVSALGLDIMITELDVNDRGTAGDIAKRDAESASLASHMLDITLSYPNCRGLLTWGTVDRYSWIRTMNTEARADGAQQRPTPRDDDYLPKPLWQAIAASLDRAPARRFRQA